MANEEHVEIIKQGVSAWNEWRKRYPETQPNLSRVDLNGADLNGADLSHANLRRAGLRRADLSHANLRSADLSNVALSGATLSEADLSGAKLVFINLRRADLSGADLSRAILRGANLDEATFDNAHLNGAVLNGAVLNGATLKGANLDEADLRDAHLNGTNFTGATVGLTIFGSVDLQTVKGLETLHHDAPSTIGIDTLERSQGNIPEVFLREAGVSDNFIAYARSLIATPIEYYTCFISYSSKDEPFAQRLRTDLQSKGVRCWFAPEDLRIGDKFWHRIDESIRMYDKLMIVLSEYSVTSEWVEREVMAALEKESKQKRSMLFPIRLDESILQLDPMPPWASDIKRQRHIGNFSQWKDHDAYQIAFKRLLRDLQSTKIFKDS